MRKWMLGICAAFLILGGTGCQKEEKPTAQETKPAQPAEKPEKKEEKRTLKYVPADGNKNKETDRCQSVFSDGK